MTETARARASRANGRKSTGPKTPAGKTRAARNARRHGLTLPVLADPALAPEAEALARKIEISVVGKEGDARQHELACRIAEALIDLRRVRQAKLPLVADLQSDPKNAAALTQFVRLDRYERRALSRRKSAIREFDAAVLPVPHPEEPAVALAKAGVSKDGPSAQAVPPRPPHGSRRVAARRSSP